jgi:4-aminobutyrate aminotransferase-like enzyme/Ser/Thr protein kinase RdoA (MazF antagonist)
MSGDQNPRPTFTPDEAGELVRRLTGIEGGVESLPSERDQNFLVSFGDGKRAVLKIAAANEDRSFLEAEQAAMGRVAAETGLCPGVVPAVSGETLTEAAGPSGLNHLVWMVTHIPGAVMGNLRYHSPSLLRDLGRSLGRVALALKDFDHPAVHRAFHWDLARGLGEIRESESLITDSGMRALVEKLADGIGRRITPLLPRLRKSVAYNDANDFNVIVEDAGAFPGKYRKVAGLVDFGDMVHSYTVADPAVAAAYAVLDKPEPLGAAAEILAGFHETFPLTVDEIGVFFDFVRLRLAMSVAIAARQLRRNPDNAYLNISQEPIRRTLPRLASVHPRFATAFFRAACGLVPDPKSVEVASWLGDNTSAFGPILDVDLRSGPVLPLDLGVSSVFVSGPDLEKGRAAIERKIGAALTEAGADAGITRHGEARPSPLPASREALNMEPETIHLGTEVYTGSRRAVFAPYPGAVHAVAPGGAGEGMSVMLAHETSEGTPFYSLVRNLDKESAASLNEGRKFVAGERIGPVARAPGDPDGVSRLHFQVVTDPLGLDAEFPARVKPSEREAWLAFSPDPNLVLGVPDGRMPTAPPSREEALARRGTCVGPSVRLSYREPLEIVRGWMQYLFDSAGRRFVDAYNNVPHVGHCHPRVVEAAASQMAVLNTNTRYLHDAVNRFAEKLTSLFPDPLGVCFLLNSASEANELALRLVRAATGRRDMLVLEGAYHGHTTSLVDISPYKHDGPGGSGPPDWVHTCPLADDYRGPYKRDDPRAGEKYAAEVKNIIEDLASRGKEVAGFIAESCPSVAGQIVFPKGYLDGVYRAVRAAGGLCVADEVQTGYGRVGTHFWAFEEQGVVPDIVVLGKPIGNGHPLAAVVTTPEIAAAFDNGMEFFSTFGGNTVSATVGLAVLDVVLEEDLQRHALRVGRIILDGLVPLRDRYPLVGDVRGSGFFLGVELVRDRETLEPAAEEAAHIVERMRERGILLGTDGVFHNVLKIRPPMPFDEDNAALFLASLERTLWEEFDR